MSNPSIAATCLCGQVCWRITGPVEPSSHCHCSRCRKAHGAAYATYVMVREEHLLFERGSDSIVRDQAATWSRPFCGRCGTVVPDRTAFAGRVFVPAGPFDDD